VILSRSIATADLGYLPADADAVIGLDFAQVRRSALWQQFVVPKLQARTITDLREFEALCGFDPLASLGSITLGLKGLGNDASVTGTIVIHGFEKAKAMSCFDRERVADAEQDGSKITIDGDVVLITDVAGNEHVAFTFADATTALIVLGPSAATKQGVEQIVAGGGTLATSSAFAETLHYVNTDAALWLMVADDSPLIGIINTAITPYTAVRLGTIYVSLNVSDTLSLDAGLRLGSPEVVASFVAAIQARIDAMNASSTLSRSFDQLDVTADGSDLIVSLAMSGDQLVQLFARRS
jgi:hypothetical protein